jgi:poly(A) polymerase Pap1
MERTTATIDSGTQTTEDCGTQTSPERKTTNNTDSDSSLDELELLLNARSLYESPEGAAKRAAVLADLGALLQGWADSIEVPSPLSPNVDTTVHVCTFGSFRLGVHNPASDMDVLCFAPSYVSRHEFFASLVEMLNSDSQATELHAVPAAYTPVMKFKYNGISIDLLFAHQSPLSDSCLYQREDDDNTKTTADTG